MNRIRWAKSLTIITDIKTYLLTGRTSNDEGVTTAVAFDRGTLLALPESRQSVEQLFRLRRKRFVVGTEVGHFVVVVILQPARATALDQIGYATCAEDVETTQDARIFVLPVTKLTALLLILFRVPRGERQKAERTG